MLTRTPHVRLLSEGAALFATKEAAPRRGKRGGPGERVSAMCDADALIGKLLEARNSTKRDKKVALTENEVRGLCQASRDIIINQPVRAESRKHTAPSGWPLTAARFVVRAGVTRTRGSDRDRRRHSRPVLRSAAHL